jgi:hypothetical protein
MTKKPNLNRREIMAAGAKTSLALAVPSIVPALTLGNVTSTSPNEQIQLGVIGFGRRCKYVLTEILKLNDVRCRVVADVQASRRDEAKKFVDTTYGGTDCEVVRDFREVLARQDIMLPWP